MISYAQNFEDAMLWRSLREVRQGCYIDLGAQDPVVDSVSHWFYEQGWRGVHVEPTPEYAAALRAARPDELVIQAVVGERRGLLPFFEIRGTGISTGDESLALRHRDRGFESRRIDVPCLPLSDILDRAPAPEVHWLKIDVEGMEAEVLRSWAPSDVRPWIVLIEATLPLSQEVTHEQWEPTILSLGYRYAYFDGLNRFYVSDRHPDLLRHFDSPPNVFDGIVLSGGASNLLSSKVNETLKASEAHVRSLEEERAALAVRIEALRAVQEDPLQVRSSEAELRQAGAEAQRRLDGVLAEFARIEGAIGQRDAALERNVALLEQVVELQRHAAELAAKVVQHEATAVAMEQAHAEALRLRDRQSADSMAAREHELGQQIADLAAQMVERDRRVTALDDSLAQAAGREGRLEAELAQARQEAEEVSARHAAALRSTRAAADELQATLRSELEGIQVRAAELSKSEQELSAAVRAARERVHFLEEEAVREESERRSAQDLLRGEVRKVQEDRDAWARRAGLLASAVDEFRRHPLGRLAMAFAGSKLALARVAAMPAESSRATSSGPGEGGARSSGHLVDSLSVYRSPSPPPPSRMNPPSSEPAVPPGAAASVDELLSLSNTDFVKAAYLTLLRRPVDPEGLAFYVESLQRSIPRMEVLRQLRASQEGARCNVSIPGLEAVLEKARRRLRIRRVLATMRHPFRVAGVSPGSPLERLLALHNGEFVAEMFLVLLNRPVDSEGYAYYLQRLRQGAPKWQLLSEVAASPEAAGRTIEGLDELLRLQRRGRLPLVGRRYRMRREYEGLSPSEMRLRSVEQQLLLGVPAAPASHEPETALPPSAALPAPVQAVAATSPAPALRLGADYGIDEPAWLAYLEKVIDSRLIRPLRIAGTNPPAATAWMWIYDTGASPQELALTTNSLEALRAASEYPVRIGIWRPARESGSPAVARDVNAATAVATELDEVLAVMKEADHAFFLAPADEVRAELHMALKHFGSFGPLLTIIDMYYREDARIYPILHHGFDAVHARAIDYCHSRFGIGAARMRAVLGRQSIANPRELMLACIDSTSGEAAAGIHIPLPLLSVSVGHRRIDALKEDAIRSSIAVGPKREPAAAASVAPTVSVIVCTKDGTHLLHQLVWRLLREPAVHDVVIVSNNSANAYALALLDDLSRVERVQVLRYARPFNFSAQCNLGARHSRGEHLLFLNDDICPVSDDWLEVLLRTMRSVPGGRAIVGPMLLYPDQTVQHAGMFLGFHNVAGHAWRHARLPDRSTSLALVAPRQLSCLTGAALLMTREVFADLNGFDPLLATYLQDVDLSLRALHSGTTLLFEPRSILFHMESVSIKPELEGRYLGGARQKEYEYFAQRWADVIRAGDEWSSPLLDPGDESMRTMRT